MEEPKVSVVIASHNVSHVIRECLTALKAQLGIEFSEVIVADSSSDGTGKIVKDCFPGVQLLQFAGSLSTPYLRAAGIAAARGEVIAILDPYCIVEDGWFSEILRIHNLRPEPVIGGAVELDGGAGQSLVGWATYFCEYGAFMPPLKEGPTVELTGNNIAYKRQALEEEKLELMGFWKTFVNRRLRAQGHELWSAPSLMVRLRKPIPFINFWRSRYQHGRAFAAMRVLNAPFYKRILRVFTIPVLPYLALWRQTRNIWPKRRNRVKFLMTLPLLFLFHLNWAWGELWGYLRGPGHSFSRIFY